MHTGVKLTSIQKTADKKGLRFSFDESLKCYCLYDKVTQQLLMEYADITVMLIVHIRTWQEEFNKMRAQAFR